VVVVVVVSIEYRCYSNKDAAKEVWDERGGGRIVETIER
jgi:hypothetical protein